MNISLNSSIPGYSYTFKGKEDVDSTELKSSDEVEQEHDVAQEDTLGIKELSEGEKAQVVDLQARDAEVKAHEAAHQGGGGGAATYTYQQGPDGKMYAIGGEVPISLETGSTPEETISNAMQVIAAATAPANPSAQDMAVAASAKSMIIKAQQEKVRELLDQSEGRETYKAQEVSNNSKVDSNVEGTNPLASLDISA